jgi:flagellum-specific peptidoglycan hydrolase FlgJ
MPTDIQLAALERIAAAAVISEGFTRMPAALTTAQCILESDWLTRLAGPNNAMGIKGTDSSETYTFTHEFLNGKWELERLAFENYPTLAACFTAHAKLLQSGRYASSWSAYLATKDLDMFIADIAPIYATSPYYTAQVTTLAHEAVVVAAIARARGAELAGAVRL